MTWFLVDVASTRDYVSRHDPDPAHPTVWVLHPPEPYRAAVLQKRAVANIEADLDGLDPGSPDFAARYATRARDRDPEESVRIEYGWILAGLSCVRSPDGAVVEAATITEDWLRRRLAPEVAREIADRVREMASVSAELEGNSGSPSA
jgi:hypothetical protein